MKSSRLLGTLLHSVVASVGAPNSINEAHNTSASSWVIFVVPTKLRLELLPLLLGVVYVERRQNAIGFNVVDKDEWRGIYIG